MNQMNLITVILACLTALEFVFIFYIETIATQSERTSKVFDLPLSVVQDQTVSLLLKNQGVYNLLIAVLIVLALFVFPSLIAVRLLMAFIICVAAYGAFTSSPKIFPMQAGFAVLCLIASFF